MSGSRLVGQRQRLLAVCRFGDDLELGPGRGEARLELRAQHRLVFGDQRGRHGVKRWRRRASLRAPPSRRVSRSSPARRAARPPPARSAPRAPKSAASRSRTLERPTPWPGGDFAGESAARVGDGDDEAIAVAPRGDRHAAPVGLRLQPVRDGVFDHRDQQHRRERVRAQRLGHVDREFEARPHPHAQDVEVRLGELELLAERRAGRGATAAARRAGTRAGARASATPAADRSRSGTAPMRAC